MGKRLKAIAKKIGLGKTPVAKSKQVNPRAIQARPVRRTAKSNPDSSTRVI